ncbi:hypothetical protein D3C81_1993850 [compost metagenome]
MLFSYIYSAEVQGTVRELQKLFKDLEVIITSIKGAEIGENFVLDSEEHRVILLGILGSVELSGTLEELEASYPPLQELAAEIKNATIEKKEGKEDGKVSSNE